MSDWDEFIEQLIKIILWGMIITLAGVVLSLSFVGVVLWLTLKIIG